MAETRLEKANSCSCLPVTGKKKKKGMCFSNKYHVFRNQTANFTNPIYVVHTVFHIFRKSARHCVPQSNKIPDFSVLGKLKHSSVQKEYLLHGFQ